MGKRIISISINALERKIVGLKREDENLKAEERLAAAELEGSREILEIIKGLKKTPKMDDPGKYGKAYYFVGKLEKNDAEKSDNPGVHHKCRVTGKLVPLIMSYEQTYDSPEGDTWEKNIFYIRGDNKGIVEVARFTRDERF